MYVFDEAEAAGSGNFMPQADEKYLARRKKKGRGESLPESLYAVAI